MFDSGIIIGMKKKERVYKTIINKLLRRHPLDAVELSFLKKEGIET